MRLPTSWVQITMGMRPSQFFFFSFCLFSPLNPSHFGLVWVFDSHLIFLWVSGTNIPTKSRPGLLNQFLTSGIDIICHLQGYLQRIQRPDKGTMWSRAKSDVSCSGYVAPVAFWSPDKQTTMTTYFSDMKMNTWSECTRKMIDSEYDRREEKKKNCFYTWTKKYW